MESTIIFFDLETTGTSISNDRIVQISMIKTDSNLEILEKKKLLLNPGIRIPKEASDVHGITNEMVLGKPFFLEYSKKIFDYMNSCDFICGFNSKQFDVPLLYEELARCNFHWIPKPQIDCSVIFKKREQRTLSAALKFYCGKDMVDAHDAEADVLATIDILRGQIFMYDISDPVKESEYDNEDEKIDIAGKIIMKDGIPVFNFGKNKGLSVKSDIQYCMWCLGAKDITLNTKNVIKAITGL
jgi:DNA polymerase-3 subunit epsilon